ncbi:hypothetical protein ACMT4L_01650 [Deinococcus sp. A31D244]|uniref:hypothetical protein n=1 Tax=Deinococcus sp. A31D244 TaxID=3397675 RepID=UPI0039DFE50F
MPNSLPDHLPGRLASPLSSPARRAPALHPGLSIAVLGVLLAPSLTAAAQSSKAQMNTTQINTARAAQAAPAPRTLDITVGQQGTELPVNVGDVLRFTLGGPSGTGYSWLALEVDPAYLRLLDRKTAAPAGDGSLPMPGGPGPVTVYRYRVLAAPHPGFTVPLMFAHVPPGQSGLVSADLIRYSLVTR